MSTDVISIDLQRTIRLIPGYDPFAQAGDCWFDDEAAELAIDFFPSCLQHIEGALAGQPFRLEPWQQAIIANLFGWKRKDDHGRTVRRFREALIYAPRKSGKTPMVSGIALYVFFCDPEVGQQNFIAAADRDQAGILFRHCRGMVEREPELANRCKSYGGNAPAGQSRSLVNEADGSFLRVISADAESKHGGNSHLIIIDELHAQPNPELYDVLHTSMASVNRAQPLFISITTADYERESVCNERYEYACAVRDNSTDKAVGVNDPSFLPVIYEAKPTDDWTSEDTWRKANPNLGVSVSLEYLKTECEKAVRIPRLQNTFKRLHLNMRTGQDVLWLPLDAWRECAGRSPDLDGRDCWGGLDLSTTQDMAAWAKVFRGATQDDPWDVLVKFFIPEARVAAMALEKDDRYRDWVRRGLLTATPGNVIDYAFIVREILDDADRYVIQEIGYDPWNATQTAVMLRETHGMNMVEVRQGMATLSEPSKKLEALVTARQLRHGGNAVLDWMAQNARVRTDPNGNIRPVKPIHGDKRKIDGIVATIIAMSRALVAPEPKRSVYETSDIVFL